MFEIIRKKYDNRSLVFNKCICKVNLSDCNKHTFTFDKDLRWNDILGCKEYVFSLRSVNRPTEKSNLYLTSCSKVYKDKFFSKYLKNFFSEEICSLFIFSHPSESEELKRLEEEQEQLNSSLLALTTHFAQVQFRLKQIVSAENDDKEVIIHINLYSYLYIVYIYIFTYTIGSICTSC